MNVSDGYQRVVSAIHILGLEVIAVRMCDKVSEWEVSVKTQVNKGLSGIEWA
jgi:hypothetical protein